MHLTALSFVQSDSFLSFGELFTGQKPLWLRIVLSACVCFSVMCWASFTQGEQDAPSVGLGENPDTQIHGFQIAKSSCFVSVLLQWSGMGFTKTDITEPKKLLLSSYKTCSRLHCCWVFRVKQRCFCYQERKWCFSPCPSCLVDVNQLIQNIF